MARPGITYADVSRAATALLEVGTPLTIDAVRAQLGSGSKSTLAPLLKQWKAERGEEQAAALDLPGDVLAQVRRLYNALEAKTDARLIELERASAAQISDLQARLAALSEEHARLDSTHRFTLDERDAARGQLAAAQAAQEDLSQELALILNRLEGVERQREDRIQELAHLRLRLDQAQHNLEHFRESVQQQREREQQEWAGRLGAQERDLQALKKAHAALQAFSAERAAEHARLDAEHRGLQERSARVLEARRVLAAELETAQDSRRQIEMELARVQGLYAHLEASTQARSQEARQMEHALVAATERVKILEDQSARAQAIIERLQEDKTSLVRAMALLEARLAQPPE